MSSEAIALKIVKLTKRYSSFPRTRKYAIQDINFEVKKGEVFGFIGRNGAGKTTTIKIICGLLYATEGEVYINGIKSEDPSARKNLGYLPEQPYFYEYLTPKETIDFYSQLRGMTKKEREKEWDRIAQLLELEDIANIRVKSFSKGMRQKIGFAIALVNNPEILILDEPMSGLDPLGRKHIRELIQKQRDLGKTIFFSSHVLADVEQICDKVAVLSYGRLVAVGELKEILRKEIQRVDVIFKNVDTKLYDKLQDEVVFIRKWDEYVHLQCQDLDKANQLVLQGLQAGASLVEFTPQKETLEDFFVRMQIKEEPSEGKGIYYSIVEE